MRKTLAICLLALIGNHSVARGTTVNTPMCSVSPLQSNCSMTATSPGRVHYASHGWVQVTISHDGRIKSRTCMFGDELGNYWIPDFSDGDLIQVRTLTSATAGVFVLGPQAGHGGVGDGFGYRC